eukprot:9761637-Alexandrium_andersonii.AAC.1
MPSLGSATWGGRARRLFPPVEIQTANGAAECDLGLLVYVPVLDKRLWRRVLDNTPGCSRWGHCVSRNSPVSCGGLELLALPLLPSGPQVFRDGCLPHGREECPTALLCLGPA